MAFRNASGSERNLVVQFLVERLFAPQGLGAAEIAAAAVPEPFALLAPVEHRQRRLEALQHDLGGVALLARLIFPLAGLKRAFEIFDGVKASRQVQANTKEVMILQEVGAMLLSSKLRETKVEEK